jgi:hypothetical protein
MRLHDFIVAEREQILIEWEQFARTCVPASMTMSVAGLRDHASEMLTEIAADLRRFRGEPEASEDSKEHAPQVNEADMTAAEEHGAERAESGFATVQVVAEYRALTTQIAEGAMRATQMVGDLLDFTRSRPGGGIPITRAEVNLRKVVTDVASEIIAAHPGEDVQVEASKEQVGDWDAARLSQALINLVGNAVEYSAPGTPVKVRVGGGQPMLPPGTSGWGSTSPSGSSTRTEGGSRWSLRRHAGPPSRSTSLAATRVSCEDRRTCGCPGIGGTGLVEHPLSGGRQTEWSLAHFR